MIDFLRQLLPFLTGLWTIPWILIGFVVTFLLSKIIPRETIDKGMKKIGLVLLYFFVPLLLFRIFLNTSFGTKEVEFSILVCGIIFFMYLIAYSYGLYKIKKMSLSNPSRSSYLKTMLTNQGRSSAFIGGAMLAIPEWSVPAAIYMALGGIGLFAIIPYLLARMHKTEAQQSTSVEQVRALPWYLKFYPWYLLTFFFAAIILHSTTGITTKSFGDAGVILNFYTAVTIPAALYYVGAGIHPSDLKLSELKKLLDHRSGKQIRDHWGTVRHIFFLTVILTPLVSLLCFTPLFYLHVIPKDWFAVIIINAFLPITSTNMFLVPYGIDKKVTAHVVTWTTLICVPIVVVLIYVLSMYL